MALVSDNEKFETEHEERTKAWDKLKTFPEYIKDFECKLNKKESLKRWGFYPLCDPKASNGNFEFFSSFSSYNHNVDRLTSSINWNGLDLFDVIDRFSDSYDEQTGELKQIDDGNTLYDPNGNACGKISEVSPLIKLTANLRFPLKVLVKEFEDQIKSFQTMFKVEIKNTQKHDHLEYLIIRLIELKIPDKDIILRLLDKDVKDLKSSNKFKKSATEKIRQAIKKQKKV